LAIQRFTEIGESLLCTSFRRIATYLIGFNTLIAVITHRISGFQQIASRIFRAADGVGSG
jgi:hypothetical protein